MQTLSLTQSINLAMRILSVRLSVRPSDKRVHYNKTEEKFIQILYHTKEHV